MNASTIANEWNIPIPKVFIALAIASPFFIAAGFGIGKMNARNDDFSRQEEYADTRFDKIDATLESIQKELHQNSIDVAQLKQQMADSKGKR